MYDDFERDNQFEDKELQCAFCPNKFTFTAGEQKFFADKNLNDPKRCPECKAKKKAEQANRDNSTSQSHDNNPRQRY